MVSGKIQKTSLLEHFYDFLAEEDWLDGVDLYQAGKVLHLRKSDGLIIAEVAEGGPVRLEVRLKIHPQGKHIQWIECTCRKNRTYGVYCEHIAATMIYIDREQQELIANLDIKMPLKHPGVVKRRVTAQQKALANEEETSLVKGSSAAQTILNHLEGSIQSVSLLAGGALLRVRIEIRPGHLTHYDLDLDASARFLLIHPSIKTATAEVKKLRVLDAEVQLGTKIFQTVIDSEECIVAEKVVAIKLREDEAPFSVLQEKKEESQEFVRLSQTSPSQSHDKPDRFQFVSLKTASKHLGKDFFFYPTIGYWPINKKETLDAWFELSTTKTYKGDRAAVLASEKFTEYASTGPVWISKDLEGLNILESPKLSEVEIHQASEGWFSLDPRYFLGGTSISMVDLMKYFKKKRRKYIKIKEGWLKIPEFITEHQWELDGSEKFLKVDQLGLLRLKAAVGDFDQFVGSKKLLNMIRNQFEFSQSVEVPTLDHTNINLRPYQENGYKWLWWLRANQLHGLLADEMGLGKTHQAMALMSAIQKTQKIPRFLVICPTTVLEHWEDKVIDFAPNLRPHRYHGPKRKDSVKEGAKRRSLHQAEKPVDEAWVFDPQYQTLITSYGVVLRDIETLEKIEWDVVILDEAHFVKNNATATYQAACRLKSKFRLCLTGTPLENHLGELKNIFDFLLPGYLGSDEYFKREFMRTIKEGGEPERELTLQRLIHPFKMRRTKELVLPDLPPKVEDLRHCSLSEEQIKMYREITALKAGSLVEQLQDDSQAVPYLHVFAVIMLLKQLCDHPAVVIEGADFRTHESGKFELLKGLIEEALDSGHKIVIFSQYLKMIDIIDQYLTETGIDHALLTGQSKKRGEIIARFQNDPQCKIFCGSLLAGGIGIDLTAANVVIHYDRWWNASKENQATDRVHRIGQNKNVQVLKLVTRGTLEEKIDRIIQSKQALFEKFLDKDEEIFRTLTREELIDLLQ